MTDTQLIAEAVWKLTGKWQRGQLVRYDPHRTIGTSKSVTDFDGIVLRYGPLNVRTRRNKDVAIHTWNTGPTTVVMRRTDACLAAYPGISRYWCAYPESLISLCPPNNND